MTREELKSQIFVGIVEDNQDPNKLGRIKIRVINVYENIPKEDLPWATPWKDLNGNTFILPEINKIVSVIFDDGNPYKPEYIFAQHYNKNLQEKLNSISDNNYSSMRSLLFDNKTQIYSNDDDGLIVDYKYNNINIKSDSVNINLKDNQSVLSLGDSKADQQSVLGNNWMDWMDVLIDHLLGKFDGPFIGNLGAPVVANPDLIDHLLKYKELRDTKFLSNNVYIIDNNKISTVVDNIDKRPNISDIGDSFNSTNKNLIPDKPNTKIDDFTPKIDLNNQANINHDPLLESKQPITPPAYVDPTIGPTSGITSKFAQEMVKVAITQIGNSEQEWNYNGVHYNAGQNSGPQVESLYQRSTANTGSGWPWCAAFICYCFKTVANKGIPYNFKLPKTASAYDFENWSKNNSSYVDIFKSPFKNDFNILPGDIIVYNFSHIGLSISSMNNGKFDTIEGNTTDKNASPSKERDGGQVAHKKNRTTSLVRSVIRLKYDPSQVKTINV